MHNERQIAEGLYWIGASDRRQSRFENMIPLRHGVSYNSYLYLDEKTCLFDTSATSVNPSFMESVIYTLGDRPLDYLVLQHVEPDHTAGIADILLRYPDVTLIGTQKTFDFLTQFNGGKPLPVETHAIKEGDTLSLGKHELTFVMAPMVHWPEVFVTYESTTKTLFSADAFGGFHALAGNLFMDEVDYEEHYLNEARRYYLNIVGKQGASVQRLFKKVEDVEIETILPLHGVGYRTPEDISYIMEKYQAWSTYTPEEEGVVICYASMYGNMESAAQRLATHLANAGIHGIRMYDISGTHPTDILSELHRFSHAVFCVLNYNTTLYYPAYNLLHELKENNFQNRKYALMVSMSWGGRAEKIAQELLESMPKMEQIGETVNVRSALTEEQDDELKALAQAIAEDLQQA